MNNQDELRHDFFVRPIADGQIEYGINKNGVAVAARKSPGKLAAMLAAQLLLAARSAHQKTGNPSPDEDHSLLAIVEPSTCAAYSHPQKPQHITVRFGFEGPTLGLALTLEAARTLANQLLAMTADGPAQ